MTNSAADPIPDSDSIFSLRAEEVRFQEAKRDRSVLAEEFVARLFEFCRLPCEFGKIFVATDESAKFDRVFKVFFDALRLERLRKFAEEAGKISLESITCQGQQLFDLVEAFMNQRIGKKIELDPDNLLKLCYFIGDEIVFLTHFFGILPKSSTDVFIGENSRQKILLFK